MRNVPPRFVLYCSAVFRLGFGLLALPWLAPSAQADPITISGGSGGGGGGGYGATSSAEGGVRDLSSIGATGGKGGYGGRSAASSGNAGGGGGGNRINGAISSSRDAGDVNNASTPTTPGTGGAAYQAGETAGASGSGPSGNAGGAGGDGASVTLSSSDTTADGIHVTGAHGGQGGQGGTMSGADGGNGGSGGSASLSLTSGSMAVSGDVTVYGGNGGSGARTSVDASASSGTGGSGGDARLTTTGALTANLVGVRSGSNGMTDTGHVHNPGAGGNAGFFASSLAAQAVTLEKFNNTGNVAFNIGTLDVTNGNTTLVLGVGIAAGTSSTVMGDNGAYIGTARLGDGQLSTPYYSTGSALISTLQLEGRGTFTEAGAPVTVGGLTVDGGTLHNGNWHLSTRAYTTTTDITLGSGGATVELGAGEDKELGRNLVGTGGLTKTGAGTLTLSGANTYSGNTAVTAGTLEISGTLNGGSYAGNLTISGTLLFIQGANQPLSGIISGTGSLTKTGAGTLTLSGANTFSGSLSIDAGNLTLDTNGQLTQASALSLGANALFDYSAASAYAAASPLALQNVTVRGQGARITPGTAGADFSGATLSYLVPQATANGATLLAVQGGASIDSTTTVGLAYASGRPNINVGGGFVLLDATTLADSGFTQLTVQTASGDIYTLNVSGNQLSAVLHQIALSGPAYERLKAYAESRAASLAFANQGLDFILNRGFGSALTVTAGSGLRFGSFGGLGGGWSRYNSGSHVDVSGLSLLAGLALGNDIAYGRITLGAFFEAGWGNYNSYNSFSTSASVDGRGDTSYHGGGVLGRYEVTEGALSGLYAEASARMGRAKADFRTGDIQYNGWNAHFDSSSLYYGLHGGLGYIWTFADKTSLDLSAKLLWTRQEGDSLTVYQDRLRFRNADSLRTRLGGRFTYAVNEYVRPYFGAYWEHEFDGNIRASVNGERLSSPSLMGSTGVGEIGLSVNPSATLPLSFDLGVQGYAGKREGVTGSLQVKWMF
ncbi:MAG: autotransporter-associated beta strand repeat-containing protein [Burkholderiaceae bacterium]|jgi:autotransporter-associated beta strand protein|nr:autotransporter-associated beta strand repeat-containing protein [Burkholderiaceae bacterium]